MQKLHLFRGIHPLYAVFLVNQLGIASRAERLQAMESVLELPRSIGPAVRVPLQKDLPPGPLATLRLDPLLAATRAGDGRGTDRAGGAGGISAAPQLRRTRPSGC